MAAECYICGREAKNGGTNDQCDDCSQYVCWRHEVEHDSVKRCPACCESHMATALADIATAVSAATATFPAVYACLADIHDLLDCLVANVKRVQDNEGVA